MAFTQLLASEKTAQKQIPLYSFSPKSRNYLPSKSEANDDSSIY